MEGIRNLAPDVAVFVGLAQEPPADEGLFHVGPSGGRCVLAVEIVSPHTRDNDVVHKRREYHEVGVPFYVIIDQEREDGPRSLLALRHGGLEYEPVPLDEEGRLRIAPLGLLLALREGRVVCIEEETGRELEDYVTAARKLQEAHQRLRSRKSTLQEALQARDAAEAQAREAQRVLLEAQRAQLDSEQASLDAQRARIDVEQARITTERSRLESTRRLLDTQERIRQLEALLRQAQGLPDEGATPG